MAFTKIVGAGIHTLSNVHTHNINSSGIITATQFVGLYSGTDGDFSGNVTIDGNLTVNGTTTTLDTNLTEVDKLEVAANNSTVGAAITQSGTGDILNLYDGSTEVFSVADGGNVTITDSIIHSGDTNTKIRFPAADTFAVETAGSERFRIDNNGKVTIGIGASAVDNVFLTIPRLSTTGSAVRLYSLRNDSAPADLDFVKSRSTTYGSYSATQDDDIIMAINSYADINSGVSFRGTYRSIYDTSTGGVHFQWGSGTSPSTSGEKMRLTATGNVGIGSVIPEQRLTVVGATDITHYPNTTINNERLQLGFNAPEGYIKAKNTTGSPAANIALYTTDTSGNTNKAMHLRYDGNIGIGTATPDSKLNLVGTGSDAATRISIKDGTGIANVVGRYGSLTFQADVDGAVSGSLINFAIDGSERLRIDSSGIVTINHGNPTSNGILKIAKDSNGEAQLRFETASANTASIVLGTDEELKFKYGGTEVLRILSDGDVGIGTGTVHNNARLQVSTNQQVVAMFEGTGVSDPQIYLGDNMASPVDNCIILGYNKADNRGYLTVGGDGDAVFTVANANKVGINKADPRTSLDVSGYIYSNSGSQIQITDSPGAKGLQLIGADDGDNYVGTMGSSGENLVFRTASSPRMRLLVGGPHLLIGGTSGMNEITESSSNAGLVIGNTSMGNGGLAIVNSTSGTGRIYFGDAVGANAARNRGQINYYHNGDYMIFATAGSPRLHITSDGKVVAGGSTGAGYPCKLQSHGAGDLLDLNSTSGAGKIRFYESGSGRFNIETLGGSSGLRFYDSLNGVERLRITSDGFIGINDSTPYTGLTINTEGDYWDTNGNTYAHPEGRVLSTWRGDRNDNTDYWVGFVGKYLKPSATVNILLQPHVGNFNNQAGMYIACEATGNYSSNFTLGKIIGGNQAGRGTSGNQRATKSQLLRITPAGDMYHTGGRIFSTRATGEAGILIGSGNAGGATLYLDGDSNGDWSGGDYAYIRHNTGGHLDIVSTNPSDDGQIIFNTGAGSYVGKITSDGVLTMTGSTNSRALEINPGTGGGSIVIDRNGYITSLIRASDGGSNVGGGSGGGARIQLAKQQIYMYTYPYVTNTGDAPNYSQVFRIDTSGNFHGSSSNNISDQRLKKDIETVTDPLTKIKGLTGRTFKWKEDSTKFDDKTKYGFIAQEVETTIPELVDTEHGIVLFDKDDKVIYDEDAAVSRSKSVNETGVIPITVEALKVLISKVETLEAKVAALEGS